MRPWSTGEIMYLEEHAGDGARSIAQHLGRSEDSVTMQAHRCGLSLRKRQQCPRCGRLTFKPMNRANGWCAECTKEARMRSLAEQVMAMRDEAEREKRNDRERQRHYSAKSRAKKTRKK